MIDRFLFLLTVCFALSVALVEPALAGPPFLTDDPEPVPYRHWETYLFSTHDVRKSEYDLQAPAFEVNVGAAPNLQLHLVVPFALVSPDEGPRAYGIGDLELGLKYRFMQEGETRPMVGTFPQIEIPTGDADRGLGNGRMWGKVALWLQKSWGPWTTYGGGGYTLNPAPAARNYWFGGWLLQRDITEKLTLGGEIFGREADSVDGRYSVLLNGGGFYKFTPDFNLLFSVGHSVAGERHLIGYLGLYWTWGQPINEGLHAKWTNLDDYRR